MEISAPEEQGRSATAPAKVSWRRQIEVCCGACGASQREPAAVLSTFCRSCGGHIKVERAGKGVGIWGRIFGRKVEGKRARVVPAGIAVSGGGGGSEVGGGGEGADGAGRFWPLLPASMDAEAARKRYLERKKSLEKAGGNGRKREIVCTGCGGRHGVAREADATQCPACGTYISLKDHVVVKRVSAPIATRGNVLVRKRGALITSKIQCHDLVVYGKVAGKTNCSGTARFRASGTVLGEIRCEKFIVEKGSKLRFLHPVHANEVEIHAPTAVEIVCYGRVWIGSKGSVTGGVLARSVKIEEGGALDGTVSILSDALDEAKEEVALVKMEEFEEKKKLARGRATRKGAVKAPNSGGKAARSGGRQKKSRGKQVGDAATLAA